VVCDEAAKNFSEHVWTGELRPTLSDRDGDAMFISTPDGKDWVFRSYQRGQDETADSWASWQWPTYANPHVDNSEVDAAREELPERIFRQEYLAEFVDESGGVFENLEERLFTADYDLETYDGTEPYAAGWDFARHEDYFVGIVLDADGDVVHYHRSQGDAWPQIQRTIERVVDEYPGPVALDASRDNKVVADLSDTLGRGRVDPVTFSPKRKRELIEDLIATVEAGELTAPDIPQLRHELEVFEYDVTPSGTVRYDAPEGFHDDSVDALALAVTARASKQDQPTLRRKSHNSPSTGSFR
jgi:phage FluMu gp28-like protein